MKADQVAGWVSIRETAAIISVSERTVRSYIARGLLPASRVGNTRTTRIRRDDIEALMRPVPVVDAPSLKPM